MTVIDFNVFKYFTSDEQSSVAQCGAVQDSAKLPSILLSGRKNTAHLFERFLSYRQTSYLKDFRKISLLVSLSNYITNYRISPLFSIPFNTFIDAIKEVNKSDSFEIQRLSRLCEPPGL